MFFDSHTRCHNVTGQLGSARSNSAASCDMCDKMSSRATAYLDYRRKRTHTSSAKCATCESMQTYGRTAHFFFFLSSSFGGAGLGKMRMWRTAMAITIACSMSARPGPSNECELFSYTRCLQQ
jgi:hypothetical protein